MEPPWWIAASLAVCIALGASLWLRALPTRADAAWVPLWLLPWGLCAMGALRSRVAPWWGLAAAAVATRVVFVGAPPLLSDDVYRYLVEGMALGQGVNPFVTPPGALLGVPESLRSQVNHPDLTSIYPPVALLWFRLLAALGGTVATAQALGAAVDLFTVAAIARVTDRRWALVYALLPLGPIEAVLGAHVDAPAVALVACAAAWARERPAVTGALLALGGGVKLLPFALLPVAARRHPAPRVVAGAALGLLCVLAAAIPVLDAGPALLTSLRTYGAHWSFNGLGLSLSAPLLGEWSRPSLLVLGAVSVGWATLRSRSLVAGWSVVGAAFVLLTPTAHPWYLLWVVVPALMSRRWSWAAAAIPLMGSYAVLYTLNGESGWSEPRWLLPATWGPALALLAVATWQRRRSPSPLAPRRELEPG